MSARAEEPGSGVEAQHRRQANPVLASDERDRPHAAGRLCHGRAGRAARPWTRSTLGTLTPPADRHAKRARRRTGDVLATGMTATAGDALMRALRAVLDVGRRGQRRPLAARLRGTEAAAPAHERHPPNASGIARFVFLYLHAVVKLPQALPRGAGSAGIRHTICRSLATERDVRSSTPAT